MVEGEGSRDVARVKEGERERITQGPVLVRVSSQNVPCSVLFRREDRHDRQSACQQPLTGNRPPELSDQQRVRFGLDVVGDEARTLFDAMVRATEIARAWSASSASSRARMALESQRTLRVTDRGWRACPGRQAFWRRRARRLRDGRLDGREKTPGSRWCGAVVFASEPRSSGRDGVRLGVRSATRPAE